MLQGPVLFFCFLKGNITFQTHLSVFFSTSNLMPREAYFLYILQQLGFKWSDLRV